jgi:hypothetical protein
MTKYQDLAPGKGEEAESYPAQSMARSPSINCGVNTRIDSWSKEEEANPAPSCRWAARPGAKRRCGWVCVKLVALLSALLALTWAFKFGALRFIHTALQPLATYDESWTFSKVNDFKLHNLIAPRGGTSRCRDAAFKSTFVVLRAEQQDDVVVHFSFKVTAQELLDDLKIEKSADSLIITYPTTDKNPRPQNECIETHTEMHVRRGLNLNDLDIKYIIGDFTIPEPLELTVDNASIYLALASFHANQFDGRKTNITLEVGSVTGTIALLDELSITTRLGSIKATIDPKPADPSAVKPADFRAVSDFGALDIDFFPPAPGPGDAAVPSRDYRTHVSSQCGSVAGRYLHGSKTTLETELGAIKAELLPIAVPGRGTDDETFLATRSERGQVTVTLLDPALAAAAGEGAVAAAAALSGLQSDHSSRAGAVNVRYPAAWQGAVEGVSRVGRVRMAGEGLEIVRRSRKGVGMSVEGRKGEDVASALCATDVGEVQFVVGGR